MKVCIFLCMSVCFIPFTISCENTRTVPSNGNFNWAFGEMLGNDFRPNFENGVAVDGLADDIRLYFKPFSNSYMYLFSMSADGEFVLVFPDSLEDFNESDYYFEYHTVFSKNILCPFLHKKTPAETRMIVSTARLKDFERLLTDYRNASGDDKRALFSDIRTYIERLRYRRSKNGGAHEPGGKSISQGLAEDIYKGVMIDLRIENFSYFFEFHLKYAVN